MINIVKYFKSTKYTVVDIGANIGTFTTWMSRAFPQGKIYSFEPQREVFKMLCGNASINNLYNVYPHNIGLGKENTKIEFEEPNYFEKNDYNNDKKQQKLLIQIYIFFLFYILNYKIQMF